MQNQKTGIATQTPKVDSHVGHSGERYVSRHFQFDLTNYLP